MPDPVDPNQPVSWIPSDTEVGQFQKLSDMTSNAGISLTNLGTISSSVGAVFDTLRNKLNGAGISLGNLNDLADDQTAKFGLITTAVLGAKEAYTSLAGVDTTRLVTFSGQISSLMETIKHGPGTSMAANAISKIGDAMKNMGAPANLIVTALADLKRGSTQVADAFFISADNTSRLQNSIMQLTIQGSGSNAMFGRISQTLDGVGDDFENLTGITDLYQQKLTETMKATHLTNDQVAQYASTINRMPGGLKALLDSTGVVSGSTNVLTDSILYATGAGRSQQEVFNDMSQAMMQYSATGTDALKFSARMTEVADSLGAQISDVHSALSSSADAFKMFVGNGSNAAAMTQGMSTAMEEYVRQLTNVGVPAQNAIDMFKNYTAQLGQMNIAQKAFLSAQSGGAGGLRGSFQIDAMIKQGDFEGLRKKTEDALKKMTGPIVSLEDATKSEGAAERYTRQIQILQQGPLGGQAKTQAEAENLLEAMRQGTALPKGGDQKTAQMSLEKVIQRGQKFEELNHTELADINTGIQALVMRAGAANLRTARSSLTAAGGALGGGVGGIGGGIGPDQQERLRSRTRGAATGGTSEGVFRDLSDLATNLPSAVGSAVRSASESMKGNSGRLARQTAEETKRHLQEANASMSAGASLGGFTDVSEFNPAYKQVGQSIPRGGGTAGQAAPGMSAAHAQGQAMPVTLVGGSGITVNFTGKCPHCGWDVHTSEQARIQSAPSQSRNH